MTNLLERLEITMEKKLFAFLLIFFMIFLAVDIVSITIIKIGSLVVVYYYLIPLIISLILSGSFIDRVRRSWFLILLIAEGLLTIVLAFTITEAVSVAILLIFIGIFSGFTLVAILGFFADVTTMAHRGKVAGVITGIAWVIGAILLSWYSSTIFNAAPQVFIFTIGLLKLSGGGVAIYILFAKTEETVAPASTINSEGRGLGELIQESYGFVWGDPKFSAYLVSFVLIFFAQGLFLPIGGAEQLPSAQTYQQIASIGFAAGGLFLFLTGFLLDKSRKKVLIYGAILTTISFAAYYFPIGATFLAGFPILLSAILVVIGDIAPDNRRARYYSVFLSLSLLAYLLGLLIGDLLTPSPWIALTCLIITAISFLSIYLWGTESNLEIVTFASSTGIPPSTIEPTPSELPPDTET